MWFSPVPFSCLDFLGLEGHLGAALPRGNLVFDFLTQLDLAYCIIGEGTYYQNTEILLVWTLYLSKASLQSGGGEKGKESLMVILYKWLYKLNDTPNKHFKIFL